MGELRFDLLCELFEMFLHRHGCYGAFVEHLRGVGLYVYVSRNGGHPYALIRKAFRWSSSREGFAYWDDLDSRWQRLVDALIGD